MSAISFGLVRPDGCRPGRDVHVSVLGGGFAGGVAPACFRFCRQSGHRSSFPFGVVNSVPHGQILVTLSHIEAIVACLRLRTERAARVAISTRAARYDWGAW